MLHACVGMCETPEERPSCPRKRGAWHPATITRSLSRSDGTGLAWGWLPFILSGASTFLKNVVGWALPTMELSVRAIHFPQVATTCSIGEWKTIRETLWSLSHDFPRKRLVWSIYVRCAGPTVLSACLVVVGERGRPAGCWFTVLAVGIKPL